MAMLEHGGRLRAAVQAYGIPLESWIDLSTGISPWYYPIPPIPDAAWHRLPESEDALDTAAARYYGNERLLSTSGSQAAIQALPHLFTPGLIAIIGPTYSEHAAAWRNAGHDVCFVSDLDAAMNRQAPVTLLCNPNNPTAAHLERTMLLNAAKQVHAHQGWLIVDEAYGDFTPEISVTANAGTVATPQLITLRSLGKFFGLAGARVGFVFGDPVLLNQLNETLGPWAINGPARWMATQALQDQPWQVMQRTRIREAGDRLQRLLESTQPFTEICATGLFSTCVLKSTAEAKGLFEHLAKQGILARLFENLAFVRIGIPDEQAWPALEDALKSWKH